MCNIRVDIYIYISTLMLHSCYCIGTRKAGDLGSTPSECQIFYLFRCVLSSMLPLRSIGRSNFVRVCIKFNNVDSKTTYFNENCCIIYIYIYIYHIYIQCIYIYTQYIYIYMHTYIHIAPND